LGPSLFDIQFAINRDWSLKTGRPLSEALKVQWTGPHFLFVRAVLPERARRRPVWAAPEVGGQVLPKTSRRAALPAQLSCPLGERAVDSGGPHHGAFLIDRYETTNNQFKKFIDSGGYRKPEYWKQDFEQNGRKLTWEEAMRLFRDSSGRPGPATWEFGEYPQGQEDYPVGGVSWHEATAYAESVGKQSPCHFHRSTPDHFDSPRQNFPASSVSISCAIDEPLYIAVAITVPQQPFKTHSLRAFPAA
jgi:hypothetical protein